MALDHKATLVNLMGLAADASDEVIANSVSSFQTEMVQYKEMTDADIVRLENSNASLTTTNTSLSSENEKLTNSNKSLIEQLVNGDLAQYKDVITNADDVKAMLINNREGGLKVLKGLKLANAAPAAPVVATTPPPAPLHNSSRASQPGPVVSGADNSTEEFAIKITNRARELQKTSPGMGWNMAFLNAKAEVTAELQIAN